MSSVRNVHHEEAYTSYWFIADQALRNICIFTKKKTNFQDRWEHLGNLSARQVKGFSISYFAALVIKEQIITAASTIFFIQH